MERTNVVKTLLTDRVIMNVLLRLITQEFYNNPEYKPSYPEMNEPCLCFPIDVKIGFDKLASIDATFVERRTNR
jgi:hypothetical protein